MQSTNSRIKTCLLTATLSLSFSLPSAIGANTPDLNQFERLVNTGDLDTKGASDLAEFVRTHPNNAKAHIILGHYYSQYNLGELAASEYKAALKIDSKNAEVWMDLANERYRHRKFKEAENILNEAEKKLPNSHQILLARGNLSLRQGNLLAAEKYLSKAKTTKPNDPEVYFGLAQLCYAKGQFLPGLKMAAEALKLKPDYADAYLAQAQLLLAMGKKPEALKALSAGFNCDPLSKTLNTLYLSEAESVGRFGEALEAALVIMGIDVNDTESLPADKEKVISIIERWKKAGAQDATIQSSIDRVATYLKGTTHLSRYWFCLGDIFDHFQQTQKAMELYKKGLAIEPTYARGHLRLGEDLESLYQYDQALACYQKAYSLKPDDLEIVSRLSSLEKRVKEQKSNVLLKFFNSLNFWPFSQPPKAP